MAVEWLRSCHRSTWRFYRDSPDALTSGFFYFAEEGAQPLPFPHYFFSATWSKGDERPLTALGPIQDAPRGWANGRLLVGFPPPLPIGASRIVGDLSFPTDVNSGPLREGILQSCWTVNRFPFSAFGSVADVDDCCLRAAYAELDRLTLTHHFDRIRAFFASWLGPGAVVSTWPELELMPAMTIVVSGAYTIVICSGTSSPFQLAVQVFQGALPPDNFGTYGTLTQWQRVAERIMMRLISTAAEPDKPILFVGDSMGAASVCVAAAMCLDFQPRREVRLLTFGCPKPGDARLQRLLRGVRQTHVVNEGDFVPLLPPNLDEALPYVALVGLIVIVLWDRWEGPNQVLIQAKNGEKHTQGPPTLLDNVIRPLIVKFAAGEPLQPISVHFMSTYRTRALLMCNCPNALIDPASWIILFPPEPIVSRIKLGDPYPIASGGLGLFAAAAYPVPVGGLVVSSPHAPAIAGIELNGTEQLGGGGLELLGAEEMSSGRLELGDELEQLGGGLELTGLEDAGGTPIAGGGLELGAFELPSVGGLELNSLGNGAGYAAVILSPLFGGGPLGATPLAAGVIYQNGVFTLYVQDANVAGQEQFTVVPLLLDHDYFLTVSIDNFILTATCEGFQATCIQSFDPTDSFVQVFMYQPYGHLVVPVSLEYLDVYPSAVGTYVWQDFFVDADGTDIGSHVPDLAPAFQIYHANPLNAPEIWSNRLIISNDGPPLGVKTFFFNYEQPANTQIVAITVRFRFSSSRP